MKRTDQLYTAILSLTSVDEARKFFRDLLTEAEIQEFSNRWLAARLLDAGTPYSKIEEQTGMSSTTIARINKWLQKGRNGYRLAIDRLHHQSSPRLRED